MVWTYSFCLVAGAVLIALSLDNDGGGLDGDGMGGNLSLLFSTPFWSFGLCGFGLCGLLMLILSPKDSGLPSLLVASAMGLAMGWGASHVLRLMSRREADTLIRNDDLVGQQGKITLTVGKEQRGFVELNVRGSLIRRPAFSNAGRLEEGTAVVVVASDQHTLRVDRL
ncbi:nodulation protein NodD [Synechococcus sp. WH 8020]|uniref:NfeD family protein n=1 Tax=unclassified Synechococcus TaxID=2626047 RepID=UPI0006527E2B|nr:NfeD family protein [Synechococcus sp. WH 8020]AKN60479.1 nodulation protein NodD [Synechococcus sp. WH 8020]